MIILNSKEISIAKEIQRLKNIAGSHSPSVATLIDQIPSIKIEIDACFLSNPYATELALEYFDSEVVSTGKYRSLIEKYPPQNRSIAESIASELNVPVGYVFLGNGASEIIQAVLSNFAGRTLFLNVPTFSPYYEFKQRRTEIVFNSLSKHTNFKVFPDAYLKGIRETRPDAIVLINPNNPDGGYIDSGDIRYILKNVKNVSTVIIDESFFHFASQNGESITENAEQIIGEFENVIIVNSLSKHYGIAGVRLGYALMTSARVDSLLKGGFLWNISGIGSYFCELISRQSYQADYKRVLDLYMTETREFFESLLQITNLRFYPSRTNFCLAELTDGSHADDLITRLLVSYGIYVRSCSDKLGIDGEFIRISARRRQENERIIAALTGAYNSSNLRCESFPN